MGKSPQEKVEEIRGYMRKYGVDALYVPSTDAHNSEYPSARDGRRAFLTNFTGSAGTALVTLDKAFLWTDGRYHLQAEKELDLSVWTLMKEGLVDTPSLTTFLEKTCTAKRVGYDPFTTPQYTYKELHDAVKSPRCMVPVKPNLVDLVWGSDQPVASANPVVVQPLEYAGQTVGDKLKNVTKELEKETADAVLISALDGVAWLFNLRGSDVAFNPVFLAYALVHKDGKANIYVNDSRLEEAAKKQLADCSVTIRPYEAIDEDIAKDFSEASEGSGRIWLDPFDNMGCYHAADKKRILTLRNPVALAKAKKNEAELKWMKTVHIHDATAVCRLICWLEGIAREGKLENETELTVSNRLDGYRAKLPNFRGLSFPTISSIGPNGAVIHYRPQRDTCRQMVQDVYLVDSGGQYLGGTTDITRTIHLGEPTSYQKECYTRVLKGHLALRHIVFPRGTFGPQLDVVARQFLWCVGLDYLHGTGHGVGSFLNVHEGPHSIAARFRGSPVEVALEPGMVCSNEPGFYEANAFGIRIENLMFAKKSTTPYKFKECYEFEDLTYVPYHKKLIDVELLTDKELEWVNEYHGKVREAVGRLLQSTDSTEDQELYKWLVKNTEVIARN